MPHKCVKCSKIFADGSPELIQGCDCGSRVFLLMREEDLSIRELTENPALFDALQKSAEQPISLEVKKIEEEKGWHKGLLNAMQLVEKEKETRERLDPIQESVENVRVLERGSYELDISSLMKGDPLIVRTRSGIYYIRIPAKLP